MGDGRGGEGEEGKVGSVVTNILLQSQRRDAFLAIGRFFGLCLWFRYTVPFMVCRHVAKMLLGR